MNPVAAPVAVLVAVGVDGKVAVVKLRVVNVAVHSCKNPTEKKKKKNVDAIGRNMRR